MRNVWKPDAILLGTDFSKASQAAAEIAQCVALQYGVELLIVHVFSYIAHHRYAAPVAWMVSELRKRAGQQLDEIKQRLSVPGCSVKTIMVDADTSPVFHLLEVSSKKKDPILVLGTHSKDGLDRFFLGSTAEEVLRGTSSPVITVGPEVSKRDRPQELKKLLLATDLTERSLTPAERMGSLLKDDTELTVLYVSKPDEAIIGEEWKKSIGERLRETLGLDPRDKRLRFEHRIGTEIALRVSEFAKEEETDLLLIGMHRGKAVTTHLHPKTGFQIIMSAPCPVYSVCT